MNIENIENFKNNNLEIDFIAEKRVYNHEKEDNVINNLFANINKLNTLSFIGKNATGKTTTLNVISDILKIYIENKSLSDCNYLEKYFKKYIKVTCVILIDKHIYMVKSMILKADNHLFFGDEIILDRKVSSSISKKSLLDEKKYKETTKRSTLKNPFLKNDDSIFSAFLNSRKDVELVFDMGRFTNFNFLGFFSSSTPLSFVNYLDPSVEKFYISKKDNSEELNKKPVFCLKFKNNELIHTMDVVEIENYLSSGTIKGMNILFNALRTLEVGGYLIIDEIENHLNKSIVINLIKLFLSDINETGATLIFTTHYSEILDTIDRSDSIYILEKKDQITIDKFSKLASGKDRIDKKKSDLVLSGELGTAPSYMAYTRLKKDIMSILKGEFNLND